jgi:putative serine protease PepD
VASRVDTSDVSTTPTEGFARVAAAVQPSVVAIRVTTASGGGSGSGVVLDSDGTIVTNNHVVDGAQDVVVSFHDGSTAPATVVGTDPSTDLAVIRAEGVSGLTPITLGTSDAVHVGDSVLALGSPLGLEGSVTAGIVSALHRTVDVGAAGSPALLADAIQTDAPINPGNSGGALVDSAGRLIGINSAIATMGSSTGGQSGSIGLGFAIPVDEMRRVTSALLAGEVPSHAVLGVSMSDSPDGGALVQEVVPGSAADEAGFEVGDVIVAVDGREIGDGTDLAGAIRSQEPGDEVSVTVKRGGEELTLTARLGSAS